MALQIRRENANFGDPADRREHRLAVAEQVIRAIEATFGAPPPLGERTVEFLQGGPCCDIQFGLYRITTSLGPTSSDAQLVYQAAHEFGHVFLGPCYTNFAIETLACAVAHHVLGALGHHDYLDSVVHCVQNELPEEIRGLHRAAFAALIRDEAQRGALPMDDRGRPLQTIAAELMRAEALPWGEFLGLAHRTQPPPTPCPPDGNPQGNVEWRYLGVKLFATEGLSVAVRDALMRFGWC
jgi:hypothetical protein